MCVRAVAGALAEGSEMIGQVGVRDGVVVSTRANTNGVYDATVLQLSLNSRVVKDTRAHGVVGLCAEWDTRPMRCEEVALTSVLTLMQRIK